ncbi:histidine phosphatase family protein [Dongia rigui]|uniref:Histidine phosphatase family protein n=1 Tax=Dongia rigui TaxID=940149 RepID=A0ABU5DXB8_9PROT|nr:histidine phosphatase family protein [Dongia rigui]MDY0871964.1 histidine phosphatase family protein [Dongia rigui]
MILIRHGQSEFNAHHDLTGRDPGIPDPQLTELGRRQVEASALKLKGHAHPIRRVLASPYTRAIQTAEIVAGTLGVPIEIEHSVHEHAHYHCDIGTPRSRLKERWPTLAFDHIDETWWPNLNETRDQVEQRCQIFHRRAAALPDWQHVAVVSHWGFILQLTGHSAVNAELVPFDPTQERKARVRA